MKLKDWNRLPPSESTQKIGYKWISRSKFSVLKVPSTIIMEEYNYLINPNHPDFAGMKIGKSQRFKFDPRLANRR
jgi:RES domain-containing protein